MALLLAMFRTLVPSIEEENLEVSDLAARLNVQVTATRQATASSRCSVASSRR